jgi:hypothetical protein
LPNLKALTIRTQSVLGSDHLHVNYRPNTDELNVLVLLQDIREDIGDQVHTLLITPSTDEYEEFSGRVDFKTSPFLSLSP